MKNILTAVLFLIAISFTSCKKEKHETYVDNSLAITVKVNEVSQNNSNPFIVASGKIEAKNSVTLSTRMMGYITKINVKVGDKVSKGQLLLSINNSDLVAKRAQVNAGISEATAGFKNAEKDFNRYTALFKDNSASQKELDDITANYNMAKARLEAANQMKNEINSQFSYANIRSPFSGVVTSKFVNTGDMANPGMSLLAVESPKIFQVSAMVAESQISKIKKGTKVNVIVKSLDKTITGKVAEISTSAKNTGGQYLVKIALDKTKENIMSGMFVSVQFPVEKVKTDDESLVLIPTGALIHSGQLTGVYTVSQTNTALLRWLRLGRTYGDKVEVLSGLNADEKYIISAQGKLFNGAKITVQ